MWVRFPPGAPCVPSRMLSRGQREPSPLLRVGSAGRGWVSTPTPPTPPSLLPAPLPLPYPRRFTGPGLVPWGKATMADPGAAVLVCPECGSAGEPDTEWNLCDVCYTKLRDEEAAAGYAAMQREQERQWWGDEW